MRLKNVTPHTLEVPALAAVVEPGQVLEVVDVEQGKVMAEQVGVWEQVTVSRSARRAGKEKS